MGKTRRNVENKQTFDATSPYSCQTQALRSFIKCLKSSIVTKKRILGAGRIFYGFSGRVGHVVFVGTISQQGSTRGAQLVFSKPDKHSTNAVHTGHTNKSFIQSLPGTMEGLTPDNEQKKSANPPRDNSQTRDPDTLTPYKSFFGSLLGAMEGLHLANTRKSSQTQFNPTKQITNHNSKLQWLPWLPKIRDKTPT